MLKIIETLISHQVDCSNSSNIAVLSNYDTLQATLEQINSETHDNYGRKAGGYLAQMDKFSTSFGLKVAHLVFFWN